MVFTATALVMAYMAGARGRHLAVAGLVCVALAIVAIKVEPYRFARIRAWPDPFKYYSTFGYQICQSLIGLGSGGPFGVGVCEGKLKLFYLPAEHTDFILSVLGEEAGLIGTLAVTGLFLFFAARGFRIAYNTKECFGRLLAGGVSAMICGQALLNMYVVTCTVPATGVPLPFISYGGSSLTLNLLSVGVLLAISKHSGPVESYEYEASANRRRYRRSRVSGDIHRRSRAGSVS
jgi:cell division protein FtsW